MQTDAAERQAMTYRAIYLRAGRIVGVTFGARTVQDAVEFAALWERMARVQVLTIKAIRPVLRLV